jgi:hypothetical protein
LEGGQSEDQIKICLESLYGDSVLLKSQIGNLIEELEGLNSLEDIIGNKKCLSLDLKQISLEEIFLMENDSGD